ncbi:CGNR zinc finger domain-containing protein [Streptomyces sp. NPDC087226]|uniref:CGNR zinc finger domain-containing protein n=1 Tax=Streptomyces sp. NPDC087226 TaxID=3365771 RepID=UPI003825A7F9
MRDSDTPLPLELALTIRHDGNGGVTDDLDHAAALEAWVRAHPHTHPAPDTFTADETDLAAVHTLRTVIRTLFAHAVHPTPPSPADASRLLPLAEALRRLNEAAARTPTVPVLDWPDGAGPVSHGRPAPGESADLTATLAHATITFLTGPDRERLRACHAPRCVRYFLKEHPRQEWCKPSCGNRARVARHHERHRRAG